MWHEMATLDAVVGTASKLTPVFFALQPSSNMPEFHLAIIA